MMWQKIKLALAFAVIAVLGACAETELAVHTVKGISDDGPPPSGRYKVGRPYQIAGQWYYPKVDYNYSETGIASWYGPGFDGKQTANGEVFNRHRLTAAHRTLPLPSVVRVTNLENGRSIKLRVNDRGPFAKSRIIDVSEKAADILGFQRQGTAKVKVEILAGESRRLASVAELGASDAVESAPAVPLEPVAVQTLTLGDNGSARRASQQPSPQAVQAARLPSTSLPAQPTGEVTQFPVTPSSIYVQVGAFARKHNAVRLQARLSRLGPSTIDEVRYEEAVLFRVRMGPLANVEQADRMLQILDGNGYHDSRIVVQ